jgi:hypothetical protein
MNGSNREKERIEEMPLKVVKTRRGMKGDYASLYVDRSEASKELVIKFRESGVNFRICAADAESGAPTLVSASGIFRGNKDIRSFISSHSKTKKTAFV